MRILCISPLFVPLADSEAFCSGKVVNALVRRGADVVVLAFGHLDSIPEEKRDASKSWDPLRERTVRLLSLQPKQLIRSSFFGLRYRTVAYARSVAQAVDAAVELHRKNPFDLVYSRSLPMIAHVVGYWTSKALALPWIANINDPWDVHLAPDLQSVNISPIEARLSNYWLRKTLRGADLITYPSERLWRYHERCSAIPHEAEVIPHIGLSRAAKGEPGTITIIHAGKIGKNEVPERSAVGFFRATSRMLENSPDLRDRFRIVFVGPVDDYTSQVAMDLGLQGNLRFTGRVDYEESLRQIGSADLCLLVEAKYKEGIYLPSKLADYVVSHKPVLALSPKVGTISDLSAIRGVYRVNPDDVESIARIMGQMIASVARGESAEIAPSAELVATFGEAAVMQKLMRCMDTVVADR